MGLRKISRPKTQFAYLVPTLAKEVGEFFIIMIFQKCPMLQEANVITISIGGNDLLGPIVAAVYTFLSGEYGLDPNAKNFEKQLADAIADDTNWETDTLSVLLASLTGLGPMFVDVITNFGSNWYDIMFAIRGLNPTADIYVMNLYNPLPNAWASYPVYGLVETPITAMNGVIDTFSPDPLSGFGYTVVNVYDKFKDAEEAVKFLDNDILSNTGYLDPHPTTYGHKLISEEHFN